MPAWAGEARLIARLEHPGDRAGIRDADAADGRVFYAMKLVAGARADRYVAGNPPLGERLRVVQPRGRSAGVRAQLRSAASRSEAAERDGGPRSARST